MRHVLGISLLLVAATLSAATFESLPTDLELLGRADLVVVATVESLVSRETADRMIVTDYRLTVEQTLKGRASTNIVVTEGGGFVNGRGVLIPGSASYEPGTRVVAFLRANEDGSYRTAYMSLGKYRFTHEEGIEVLVRDGDIVALDGREPFEVRPAQEFMDAVRDGAPDEAPRIVHSTLRDLHPRTEGNPADYVFKHTDGTPLRWDCPGPSNCAINFKVNQVHPVVDTLDGLQEAYDAWTDDSNSWVALDTNGVGDDTAETNDDENDIIFDWNGINPHEVCEAGKGCGIIYYNGPPDDHTFRGVDFFDIVSADVLVRDSVTNQTVFEAILAHEIGHGLGIKHGPSGSLMAPSIPTGSGAQLKAWDKEAMAEVYGNGLPCQNVAITGTSGGGNVDFGEKKTLSVQATGTTPFTYQWYEGTAGDDSNPVGSNSSSYQTPNITTTRNFWVRVSNSCPSSANSQTITVTPLPCDEPEIITQPQSKRINPGQTTTLMVQATGTALDYQWYQGALGNTSNPVGSDQNTYTTPPLNATTSYWVKVSNNCGSENSALATITVSAECVPPAITTQPTNVDVEIGQGATLAVSVSGDSPFTYQWYMGESGDPSNPIAGATAASHAIGPFSAPGIHKFWVKINNACGEVGSATITVNVTGCVPVTISNQPTSVNVGIGEGATIGISVEGTPPFTYQWYAGEAGDPSNPILGATNATYAAGPFNTPGTFKFWVKAGNACTPLGTGSATINVIVACPIIEIPGIFAPPLVPHTMQYDISWTGDPAISTFELQEATNAGFTTNLVTYPVSGALQQTIPAHDDIDEDTRYYYRVRALSVCTGQPTVYSAIVSTVVTQPLPENSLQFAVSIPDGSNEPYTQDYLVPGFGETATNSDTFSISIDVPWMTVFPPSGALSAGGTTVQLTIDPSALEIGSTTATITVTRTQGAGKTGTNNGPTTSTVPFNVSIVTPVTPSTRDNPPPGTLIIPAVAHAQGIGSPFQSDVRIANVGFNDITYEISFTPSGNGGWASNKMTTVTIRSGDTLAFDDIVKAWYGSGLLGESGSGTIEIRPLEGADPLSTFASSRTYALVGTGTLGQFIPALAQNQFITNSPSDSLARISLQQIANSAAYRSNIGFVEGSGAPVDVLARLLDGNNNLLATRQFQLGPFEHLQNSLGGLFNNTNIEDGRVEVETLSPSGLVTAYASVINNTTNDPFLVFPEQPARETSERYVLPGIAEFVAPDGRNFHSDMRIYNGGAAPVTFTLEYYERGQSTPRADAPIIERTLNAGQVLAVNDVLPNLFNLSAGGGSVVAKAPAGASLVLTAQTYSRQTDGGTKGQFIPGVTPADGVGFAERAVEVLQLEQSTQYRSNLGLVEVTGNDIVVEVTATEADTKVSSSTSVPLKANEYRQLDRILESMGLGTVYNGRVSVKVLTGNGRVAAYASTIDNRTEDPTYVPSQ